MKRKKWSPREIAIVADGMKQGLTIYDLFGQLPGRTISAIAKRASMLGLYIRSKRKNAATTGETQRQRILKNFRTPSSETKSSARVRPCLNCRDPFKSKGPHNRLCRKCTGMPVSPFEP